MRTSWRSWFWNIATMLVMFLMAALVTGVAVAEVSVYRAVPGAVIFGIMSVVFWTATVRALLLGVVVSSAGIVMRGLGRTVTIPWSEIEEITTDEMSSGASGALGATSVVVVRNRPGKGLKRVELNVLGGYGARQPTLADQALKDLTAHLNRWRAGSAQAH